MKGVQTFTASTIEMTKILERDIMHLSLEGTVPFRMARVLQHCLH